MRRLIALTGSIALLAGSGAGSAAPTGTHCVHPTKPGCLSTVPAAVNAAQDGDTIEIGRGAFAGRITIDESVRLVGVSAGASRIEGGGPVITIGDGTANQIVSISRVTITGGFNDSKPESQFGPGFFAAGDGVRIPEAADHTTGATVTISDSVVSGNRVTAGPSHSGSDRHGPRLTWRGNAGSNG